MSACACERNSMIASLTLCKIKNGQRPELVYARSGENPHVLNRNRMRVFSNCYTTILPLLVCGRRRPSFLLERRRVGVHSLRQRRWSLGLPRFGRGFSLVRFRRLSAGLETKGSH